MFNEKHGMIELSYEDFKKYGQSMESGIVMFTEHIALVYYPVNPSIRYKIVKPDAYFEKKDFDFLGNKFQIIGKGPNEIKSSWQMFIDDILDNKGKLLAFIIIYAILVNPWVLDLDIISSLNEVMIGVVGVYISMLFVFIGFFYSDKERTIDVYKKGVGCKEYLIDKYVICLSIFSLIFFSLSFLICNVKLNNLPTEMVKKPIIQLLQNHNILYWVAFLLTLIAICILIMEFSTLINYYLKDFRNKYFIDAFEEHIKESNK